MSDQILYEYGHIFKLSHYTNPEIGKVVRKHLDRLDAIYKLATEKVRETNRTPDLTARGKVKEFRNIAAEIDKNLVEVKQAGRAFGRRATQIAESMAPKRHDRNDLAWQLELREIRDHIRSLDQVEVESFILSAVERGDQRIMEAVEFAPIPFTFATQQMIDEIRAARSKKQYPELAEQLCDDKRAEAEVLSALGSVTSNLGQLGLKTALEGHTQADAA